MDDWVASEVEIINEDDNVTTLLTKFVADARADKTLNAIQENDFKGGSFALSKAVRGNFECNIPMYFVAPKNDEGAINIKEQLKSGGNPPSI